MSVDFSSIIENFLTVELGDEVRGSLVQIAQALQNAINSQLNTVTDDFSDTSSNSAAQAGAVGAALSEIASSFLSTITNYGVLPNNADVHDIISNNPIGVTGNSFYELNGSYSYSNAPEPAGYVLSVRSKQANVDSGCQIFFGSSGDIYTCFKRTGTWEADWIGGIDPTLAIKTKAANAAVVGSAMDAISPYDGKLNWTLKKSVDGNGNLVTNNYVATTDLLPCVGGDMVQNLSPSNDNGYILRFFVAEYFNGSFVRRSADLVNGKYVVVGNDANGIRVCFGRSSASGTEITQSDIDNFFNMRFATKSLSKTQYDTTGYSMRGNIISLGYTSFAECNKSGVYTFGTGDIENISDVPDGVTSGGKLTVTVNGGVTWQELDSTRYHLIRYSTSGSWFDVQPWTPKKSKPALVNYETGDFASGDSSERLNVYLPATNGYLHYTIYHYINNDIKCNGWQVGYLYHSNDNFTSNEPLTIGGEWECAIHLADRNDFSGGHTHGDEVMTGFALFIDGKPVNASSLTENTEFAELRIVQTSMFFDPADHTTEIAEHGKEYIFNAITGLTINQSVEWRVASALENCYMAMFLPGKTKTNRAYLNSDYKTLTLDSDNFSVRKPNANECVMYRSGGGMFADISVPVYPTGLPGGDAALVTDNGGLSYNKLYYIVCTGGNSTVGELWKSSTVYNIDFN